MYGLVHAKLRGPCLGECSCLMRVCSDVCSRPGSLAALEAACSSRTSAPQQSVLAASGRQRRQAAPGDVPLTVTRLTETLREQEDAVFEL